jgi:hypothetical protein
VGLLLDFKYDVSCLDSGSLVTLALELHAGAAADALVDVDVEDFAVDNGLLAVALLAAILVLDDFTLAITVRADSLEALDHGAHLAHHGLHTMAVTAGALLDSTLLSTDAGALGADDGSLKSKLRNLAAIDILEGDLMGVVNGTGLRRTTVPTHAAKHASHAAESTAAAEELGEEVLGGHAAATSTALESGLTILVVHCALLGIGQDFVGVGDLFELVLGRGVVGVLVWTSLSAG